MDIHLRLLAALVSRVYLLLPFFTLCAQIFSTNLMQTHRARSWAGQNQSNSVDISGVVLIYTHCRSDSDSLYGLGKHMEAGRQWSRIPAGTPSGHPMISVCMPWKCGLNFTLDYELSNACSTCSLCTNRGVCSGWFVCLYSCKQL